ncbi:hypothetical protein N7507_010623 [Penicillium longicatenatum]|nr:hypothetical protein N7507_010623 [Penicillium longicatenatum]
MMEMDAPPLPPPPPPPPPPGPTDPRLSNQPPRPSIITSLPRSSSTPIPISAANLSLPTPLSTSQTQSKNDITLAKAGSSGGPRPQDPPVLELDSSNILTILAKFNESHFNLLNQQNEKKRLEDIAAQNKRDVDRAKTMKMYPATAEMYQQMKEKSDNDISRLNQSLNQHQAICQQITAEFVKHQHLLSLPAKTKTVEPVEPMQSPEPSGIEIERINKLEAELNRLKEAKSGTQTSSNMPSKIENSIVEHSTRISRMLKDIGELSTWRNEIREGKTKLPLESMPVDLSALAAEVTTVKENIHPNLERSLATVAQVPSLQARLDLAEQKYSSIITLESSVKNNYAETSGLKSKITDIETTIIELNKRFGNLEIQRAEPSQQAAGNDQSLIQGAIIWTGRVEALETAHSKLDASMKALLAQGAVWTEACTSLTPDLKKLESKQDSFKVALRSIEMRYENINTESLVKQMTHAICEMYPTLPQITDEVKALKAEFSSNTRSLADRIDNLNENVSSMPDGILVKAKDAAMDQLQSFERQLNEVAKLNQLFADRFLSTEDRVDKLSSNIASIPDKLKEVTDSINDIEQVQVSHSDRISKNLQNVNDLQESSNSLSTAFQELADDHSDDVKRLADTCDQLSIETKTRAETQDSHHYALAGAFQTLKASLEELQTWTSRLKILEPVEDIVNICGAFGSPESIDSMRKRLEAQESVFAVLDQLQALESEHSEHLGRLEKMSAELAEKARRLQDSEAAHPVGVVSGRVLTPELHVRGSSTLARPSTPIEPSNDSTGIRESNQPHQLTDSGDEHGTLASSSVVAGHRTPLPPPIGPSEPSKKKQKVRKQDGKRPRQSTGSDDESSVATGNGAPALSSSGPSGPPKKIPKIRKHDNKGSTGSGDEYETSTASPALTGTSTPVRPPSGPSGPSVPSSKKKNKKSRRKDREKAKN